MHDQAAIRFRQLPGFGRDGLFQIIICLVPFQRRKRQRSDLDKDSFVWSRQSAVEWFRLVYHFH